MGDDELPEEAREFFRKQGSIGGKLGGKVRAKKLTPAQRKASAQKAARARWGPKKKPKS